MKRLTTAAIAGAAGAALLLGGAGTLAFWTDTETTDDAVIQAGTLELGALGDGPIPATIQQVVDGVTTDPVPYVPGTTLVVPGDVITFIQDVDVTQTGTNVASAFVGTVAAEASSTEAADVALADALASDAEVTVDGATGDLTIADGEISGEGTGTITISTAVTFPFGAEGEFNAAKLGSVDFSVAYTLTQVPAGT